MDTIVALSTPIGRGAIAVIRVSGSNSINIAKQLTRPMPTQPNMLKVGSFNAGHFVDQVMSVYFVAPHSYTGEDMVEIHCHGGVAVVECIINAIIEQGARMAYNGEFSKRAFVNGKQNLAVAEGIIDMIDAETATQAQTASLLMSNQLGKRIGTLQDRLTDIISSCEVALDYPEEDIELPTTHSIQQTLTNVTQDIDNLLATATVGKIIKYGINIAIVGQPNVGKSSLLNALLGYDRAIVTSIAGTTRDTITESMVYKGIKFNFIDTAGLRDTDDEVEQLGIERSHQAIMQADIILHIVNDTNEDMPCQGNIIKLYNKCDTIEYTNIHDGYAISAKNNINIDFVLDKIYSLYSNNKISTTDTILTNSRHISCLTRARQHLGNAIEQCHNNTLDCITTDIRSGWDSLGEITGTVATEDIITRIYSKFCLGK